MAPQRLFLFGDQTVEKVPSIRNLVKLSKKSPALQRFLQEATDVVQREAAALDTDDRKLFFAFDDLLSLAEKNAKAPDQTEVVPTTLITIVRLGELMLSVLATHRLKYTTDEIIVMSKMTQLSWIAPLLKYICWVFVQVCSLQ